MTSMHYSMIRFIGYAISTFPAKLKDGYRGGTYLGNDDLAIDIAARIEILKNAVEVARAELPRGENEHQVINVFMVPEFFFHGSQGPYVFESPEDDPIIQIRAGLVEVFNSHTYPNWTFVFGTVVTTNVANAIELFQSESVLVRNKIVKFLAQEENRTTGLMNEIVNDALHNLIKECQIHPNVIVRDRAIIISNIPLDSPTKIFNANEMTTEKYYISGEDFVLFSTGDREDIVTEQMAAYEHIDLSNGDIKQNPDDSYAIFRQNYGGENIPKYMDFAVEICLDHDDERLRQNLGKEPFPERNDAIHVQLIPSCGMAIQVNSVVAGKYGFVFNCDGQYPLDQSSDDPQQGSIGGVQCVYANYNPSPTDAYNYHSAHTQLARVKTAARGSNPNLSSASFETLEVDDVVIYPVPRPDLTDGDIGDYFAGGNGAIHIYGLKNPYVLFPDETISKN